MIVSDGKIVLGRSNVGFSARVIPSLNFCGTGPTKLSIGPTRVADNQEMKRASPSGKTSASDLGQSAPAGFVGTTGPHESHHRVVKFPALLSASVKRV
jgi:hypothetical protein